MKGGEPMGKYLVAIGIVWVVFSLVVGFIVVSTPTAPTRQVSRSQVNYTPPPKTAASQPSNVTKTQLDIIQPDVTSFRLNVVK